MLAATTPRQLARRIAASDDPVVVVDVRDHADHAAWRIEAPGVPLDVRNLPLDTAMRRLDALADELPDGADVVVADYVGEQAVDVASALRERGVNASVLTGGMAAWSRLLRPVRVRMSAGPLKVIQVQRVSRGCLSYVLIADGDALVVDPGNDVGGYAALAARYDAVIRSVFDTHLHGDHLSGARALARETGAELLLPALSLPRISFADEVSAVSDGDVVRIGSAESRVLALPGHTADMTGLLLGSSVLMAGDSLRAGGLAPPEAHGEEEALRLAGQLHDTLHERIFALGGRVRLLPGHYAGGVRRAPVAPTVSEARASVPEAELPRAAFAKRVARSLGPPSGRIEQVTGANAGRAEAGPDIEAGALALA